jgi:hypothetical protein
VIANRVTFLDRQATAPLPEERVEEPNVGEWVPEDIPF